MKYKIKTGADRIVEFHKVFQGKRIGLITSQSGVLSDLTSTIDKFTSCYNLKALFAPEHGIRGEQQDGMDINSYIDKRTGVPVYSIYGNKRSPVIEELENVDILVYDIQDVGSRYYTFIYSMANSMKVAKKKGIPFVILDRPNLISGLYPEGSPMMDKYRSFIGQYNIPQRYSLTAGELALMLNKTEKIDVELIVIPLEGWNRSLFFDDLDYHWINPSPNIASFEASLFYNGTCLFEGTTLSEGRGTTRPFEMIGAPWIDSEKFASILNSMDIPGICFREVSFVPQFHKFQGMLCHGVQLHIKDKYAIRPFSTGLKMLYVAKEIGKENFKFIPPKHEVGDFTIDLMFGSSLIRESFDLDNVMSVINFYTAEYKENYQEYWIYK